MISVYSTIWTLILITFVGWLLTKKGMLTTETNKSIFIILWWVAFPALIISVFMKSQFDWHYLNLTLTCWIASTILLALVLISYKIFGRFISKSELGSLIVLIVVTNSSWVGYPLVIGILGQKAMDRAVIASELWTTIAVQLLVVLMPIFFATDTQKKNGFFQTLVEMIKKPVIIALPIGIALYYIYKTIPVNYQDFFKPLDYCAGMLIPLICIYIGIFLWTNRQKETKESLLFQWSKPFATSLFLLLGMPTLIYYVGTIIGLDTLSLQVVTLLAASPPILLSIVIGQNAKLDMHLIVRTLLISFPLCPITVSILCKFLLHM